MGGKARAMRVVRTALPNYGRSTEMQSTRRIGDGGPVRMILSVDDPEAVFAPALAAGATELAAIYESHGWRTGRTADPCGGHPEIGRPL